MSTCTVTAPATCEGVFYAGVDSGSWNTKAAVIDVRGVLLGCSSVRTGADLVAAAEQALSLALDSAGVARAAVRSVWATGFGRHSLPLADGIRTELDSHARGVLSSLAGPFTIVDIGGQDAKVIRVDGAGRRVMHRMNRKCAAGTGSFLEEMALRLDVAADELPRLAAGWTKEVELGSYCTVFSGTELLAAIRRGQRPADLVRAAYRSVARRVLEMERLDGPVVATGGVVAHHPMVVRLMQEMTGLEVKVPDHAQEVGALGVALAAGGAGMNRREEIR